MYFLAEKREKLFKSKPGMTYTMKTRKREESHSTALYWFVLASDGKWLWPSAVGHPETKTSETELPLQICGDDTLFTPTEFNLKLLCEIL